MLHYLFCLLYGEFAIVEDTCCQGSFSAADQYSIGEVVRASGSAACDDRNGDGPGYGRGNLEIVSILGPIGVHTGEDNLTSPEPFDFLRPGDCFEPGG